MRAGLLFLLLYFLFRHQITVGQFFSIFLCYQFIFIPLQELGSVVSAFQEAQASLRRMSAILDSPLEHRPANPTPIGPLESIAFRDVTFEYPGATSDAVRSVSFEVARGETVALVGPSGSGKTTLVKLLAGLYAPSAGNIEFNGVPANHLDIDALRERIGLVTQDSQLFTGTIRDNLIFVKPQADDADCIAALQEASATALLERGGQGLDTVIGEGGMRVSGGERQRISIARALLRNAELFLFDEPTASLDSLTEEEVVRTMQTVHRRQNSMTVVIAHRLSTIRHADRIYVLEDGAIVDEGTHDELVSRDGLYYVLWRQQTSIGRRGAQATI
jgi:ATP-binding cassette subfamily B protein